MINFFLVVLLFSTSSFAWIKPNVFDSSYIKLEESILRNTINGKFSNASSALEVETVNAILSDKKNLVKDDFIIPKYFQGSTRFWFSIYTQYSSKQVVIHDKSDLRVVYNIIDFSELNNSNINKYAKAKLQSQLSLEYTRRLKKILKKFSKSTRKLSSEEKGILQAIKKVHKIPKSKKKRKKLFNKLALNIRTQTGQRDMIYRGVIRSIPYFPYLTKKIKEFNLPKELLAITFLESSFNPKAYSKVGAAGAWQFMPYIASLFMPRRSSAVDYRLNPIISSISAFHLLKQNKMILKRWDLAVPAYNSGTKHLVKARRKYKKIKNLSLEYILKHYKHAHLGFASKNFYSEFLALVHVLAYKDVIYPLKGFDKNKSNLNTKNLNIYVSKCSINPKKFIKILKKSSPRISELNSHFRHKKKTFKRGALIVSDVKLTAKRYYKLSSKQMKKKYPKNWPKYIYKKRCGRL
jgi:membrane-bound lytic murein transglycosylase D